MDALQLPTEFRREIDALLGTQSGEFWRAYDRPHWRALRLNPRRGLRPGAKDADKDGIQGAHAGAAQVRLYDGVQGAHADAAQVRLYIDGVQGAHADAAQAPAFALRGAPDFSAARELARRYIDRPVPWQPGAYYIAGDTMPGASLMHLTGLYYIQEPSAMAAGAALDVRPGMRVLDLCAAPGGKSSQLAAALAGEGLLVANEPITGRARMLAGNIERQGFANVIVTNEYPERLAARWGEAFDAILVDAPCSGEGMFRRDEGALREWTPDAPRACHLRQLDILDSAHALLRPGGALVYSTCTFNRRENEDTIAEFLRRYPDMAAEDFELAGLGASRDGMLRLWPHVIDGEGHFVCRLRRHARTGANPGALDRAATPERTPAGPRTRRSRSAQPRPDARRTDAARALRQLRDECALPEFDGEATLFGAQLSLLPLGCPPLDGVRVALTGLALAEVGRSHIAPAYALCRALAPGADSLEVDTREALRLVRGEQIARSAAGWVMLHWQGLPVCPGKAHDGIVKSHYPRGLKPLGTIAEEST